MAHETWRKCNLSDLDNADPPIMLNRVVFISTLTIKVACMSLKTYVIL